MVKEKKLLTKVIALLHFKQKSGVLNRYNSLISPLEFNTRKSTKHSKSVQELISILAPNKSKDDLKRFGHKGDGSYVLPKNIVNPKTYLISGGISDNNEFEIELAKKGVIGIQIDNSVNKAPKEHRNLVFKFATLGANDNRHEVSLENLISSAPSKEKLIVKLDIEGFEITALQYLSDKSLKRINCLALELHNLSSLVENNNILHTLIKLKKSGLSSVSLCCLKIHDSQIQLLRMSTRLSECESAIERKRECDREERGGGKSITVRVCVVVVCISVRLCDKLLRSVTCGWGA